MSSDSLIKGLIALFLFFSYLNASSSKIDDLVANKNIQELAKLIKNAKVINNEINLPDYPKENDLIIIENEYDVKVLFEYVNGQWDEKSNKTIADVLNDQKSTYMHLFNYKVNSKDFDPYVSDKDSLKVTESSKRVLSKIITSNFNDTAINSIIKTFLEKHLV